MLLDQSWFFQPIMEMTMGGKKHKTQHNNINKKPRATDLTLQYKLFSSCELISVFVPVLGQYLKMIFSPITSASLHKLQNTQHLLF